MFKFKQKKGFTLIELIVVMAVIGILVLLAMPKFMGHTKDAKFTKLISNTKQLENASERYYMDKNNWPKLTDVPYTLSEITAFAEKIYDTTGKEVNLDMDGKYYDIDYSKISQYIQIPDNKMDYIIQNPVGNVYALKNLTKQAETRTTDISVTGVTLNDSTMSVNVSSTVQLNASILPTNATNKIVIWTSSNTAITTVSNTGLVTGISIGNSIITATTQDGNFVTNCNITVQLPFTTATFTNASAIAHAGPTQIQLNTTYVGTLLSGKVTSSNGIQLWTVPKTGTYRIEAYGAEGGGPYGSGGNGAIIKGDFNLNKGEILKILVGQLGGSYDPNIRASGGGGGSFIATSINIPLIVAGGGGGANYSCGFDATTTNIGTNGGTANIYGGAAGGGWTTNGANDVGTYPSNGGKSFLNGGNGGPYQNGSGGGGGFGGGGSSYISGGGGGGYNGGNVNTMGYPGNGGGSYNSGVNQGNTIGNTGNGKVIITDIS